MKKVILLFAILFATTSFSQEVFNTEVRFNETPNFTVPDSVLTKDSSNTIRSTSIGDLGAVLGTGSFLKNVKDDLSPQLGADLDLNNFNIIGTGNVNITGTADFFGRLRTTADFEVQQEVALIAFPSTRQDGVGVNYLFTDGSGNLQSGLSSGLGATMTSELINDGETGSSRYIEEFDIEFMESASIIIGGMADDYNTPTQALTLFSQYNGSTPIVKVFNNNSYIKIDSFCIMSNVLANEPTLTFLIVNEFLTGATGNSICQGSVNLEFVKLIPTTTISQSAFQFCSGLNFSLCEFPNVSTIEQNAFKDCNLLDRTEPCVFPNMVAITSFSEAFSEVRAHISMPNAVSIAGKSNAFKEFKGIIDIPLLDILDPATTGNMFSLVNSQTVVNCLYTLKTANAGLVHASIQQAIDLGATVNFIGSPNVSQWINDGQDGVKPYIDEISFQVACSDLNTSISAGTSKAYFRMPYEATVFGVRVSLLDAGTVTGITVDINEDGVSILSTKLTTDATEKTSTTASIPAVISDSTLADDSEITIDFDGVPTSGKGIIVTLLISK